MSQMGGWAVLDYALHFAEKPADYLRLGYASMLSSWALINAGDAESNYGFWYPGTLHDGAVGWGFCPQQVGQEWNKGCWDKDLGGVPRGIWPVCGEIDHGLCAGIEAASTVVLDDPIFGLFAYGGSLDRKGQQVRVICRDGVRRRLHFLKGDTRFHLSLDGDGFARDVPVVFDESLKRIEFSLENRSRTAHTTKVTLSGLPSGTYLLFVDGKTPQTLNAQTTEDVICEVSVPANRKTIRVVAERANLPDGSIQNVHHQDVLRPFDFAGVQLLPGRLHDQFHQVKDYYLNIRNADILKLFRLRKSNRAPGRELGGAYSD
ncbi:MAG: hypothetical protein MI892_01745, partial [Desulfobacterales bacterium]|nr:hypothetical protein [Desulfobacterales bacterium]